MHDIKQFGFQALWSPYFLLFTIGVIILFFYLTIKKRHLFPGEEKLQTKEAIGFTFTIFLLYVIKGSPVDLLGHLMFTFHMVQMAILNLLIPALLIIFVPTWIWERILSFRVYRVIHRFFTKPLIALLLFNGMFSFYHVPFIFDAIKMNIFSHVFYTVLLFIAAFFMWWPLVNKVPGENRLSGLQKGFYLIADSVLITPACALIIFNTVPMYETYTNSDFWIKSLALCVPIDKLSNLNLSGPEMFNFMTALEDQQTGGVIMKFLQEIIYITVLYRAFREWFKKEREKEEQSTIELIEN